jgi:hypothetical protein
MPTYQVLRANNAWIRFLQQRRVLNANIALETDSGSTLLPAQAMFVRPRLLPKRSLQLQFPLTQVNSYRGFLLLLLDCWLVCFFGA